jgi:cell shape-determining protein MreD
VPSLWFVSIVTWLVQDFFQVLTNPFSGIPDFYVLTLGMLLVNNREGKEIHLLVAAFVGGLLWDLRWGSPLGFSSLFYVSAMLAVKLIWGAISQTARTPLSGTLLVLGSHICISIAEAFIFDAPILHIGLAFVVKQAGAFLFCIFMNAYIFHREMD